MDVINGIIETYSMFFNWNMWIEVLSNPVSWGLIGSLIILEGLLSADNALVLAVMVKHLPVKKRKKALFYGLLGAYIFRFIAIGIGVFLIQLWFVKIFGALYLVGLSIKYFIDKRTKKGEEKINGINKKGLLIRFFGTFWGTVVAVEIMDIAFSLDSVLAALGISEQIWVLLLGGMLGVLMMRGIAGIFIQLIDLIPELETTAYILIAIIAVKMLIGVWGVHINHYVFFTILVVTFAETFIIHFMRKKSYS